MSRYRGRGAGNSSEVQDDTIGYDDRDDPEPYERQYEEYDDLSDVERQLNIKIKRR
jgi:hypothetical protein